jgi:hypothetical protein
LPRFLVGKSIEAAIFDTLSPHMSPEERELIEPVKLCTPDGRLDRAAVGWSRRPLHRCNLSGRFPRKKRWDWWGLTDEKWFITLLVADIDWLGGALLDVVDLETGRKFFRVAPRPFGAGVRLPEEVGGAPIDCSGLGLSVEMAPCDGGVELRARASGVQLDVRVDRRGRDTLNVVVPWDDRRFQFTSKQIGLPATGTITWGERTIQLDGAANLDFGRGTWPSDTRWNWAAGFGRDLAFNLGGRWTDGTGVTENGLFINGRLHKISETVRFDERANEWRIRSDGSAVDLRFIPAHRRKIGFRPAPRLHWCAGRFHGRILDQTIDGLFGWAEDFAARW